MYAVSWQIDDHKSNNFRPICTAMDHVEDFKCTQMNNKPMPSSIDWKSSKKLITTMKSAEREINRHLHASLSF